MSEPKNPAFHIWRHQTRKSHHVFQLLTGETPIFSLGELLKVVDRPLNKADGAIAKMPAQKIKTIFRAVLIASTLAALTACSTTGTMTMNSQSQDSVIKGRGVALIVTAPHASESDIVIQLRGQVATQLLGAGLFQSITDPTGKEADYKIDIKLTKVDVVSGLSRVLWGAMAGSNKLAGNVTVIDARTGQVVRSFSFEGDSAANPLSGKADMKDAIDAASEEIIKGLS